MKKYLALAIALIAMLAMLTMGVSAVTVTISGGDWDGVVLTATSNESADDKDRPMIEMDGETYVLLERGESSKTPTFTVSGFPEGTASIPYLVETIYADYGSSVSVADGATSVVVPNATYVDFDDDTPLGAQTLVTTMTICDTKISGSENYYVLAYGVDKDDWLAENGYVKGDDGIYVIAVAQIGDNYYGSLEDAIEDAGTTATTITMLSDTDGTFTIADGQDITIDLAGKTISNTSTVLTNNGTLTIKDTVGGGSVATSSTSAYVALIKDAGTLTLNGGSYVGFVVAMTGNDLVHLVENVGSDVTVTIKTYSVTLTEDLTVPQNVSLMTWLSGYIVTIEDGVTLTNNGTLGGNTYFYAVINKGGTLINNGTYNVYVAKNYGTLTNNSYMTTSAYVLNEGTFNQNGIFDYEAENIREGSAYYGKGGNVINLAADGDTVKLVADSVYTSNFAPANDITIDLNGFTFEQTKKTTSAYIESDVTIKNGTLILSGTGASTSAFYVCAGYSLTLDNVDYTTTGTGVGVCGTNATINIINGSKVTTPVYGVTTNAATTDNHGVIINIQDSTMYCTGEYNGVYDTYCVIPVMINVPGTLTVNNCKIYTNHVGVLVRGGTATITNTYIYQNGLCAYDTTQWGSGSATPSGGIVLGNGKSGYYQYPTVCTVENVTMDLVQGKVQYGNSTVVPVIFAQGVSEVYDVTLNFVGDFDIPVDSEMVLLGSVSVETDDTIYCYGEINGDIDVITGDIVYDIDKNGAIDNGDVLIILQIATGAETSANYIARADINGDDKVNSLDAYELYQKL